MFAGQCTLSSGSSLLPPGVYFGDISFYFFYYIYLLMCLHVPLCVCVGRGRGVSGQLRGVKSPFYHVSSGDQTQVVQLGTWPLSMLCLYW